MKKPTYDGQNCTDAGRERAQTCFGWRDKQSHDDPRRPESAMAGRPQRDAVGGDGSWTRMAGGGVNPDLPTVQREVAGAREHASESN
jgi:hypothetical protein